MSHLESEYANTSHYSIEVVEGWMLNKFPLGNLSEQEQSLVRATFHLLRVLLQDSQKQASELESIIDAKMFESAEKS